LRNRLKYALTGKEVTAIVKQRIIKVDGKVRTDETFPAGFMGTSTSRIERSLADYQMSSLSRRAENTSDCFTTSRVDSPFTESLQRKHLSNS
jgi:hypothetical protein